LLDAGRANAGREAEAFPAIGVRLEQPLGLHPLEPERQAQAADVIRQRRMPTRSRTPEPVVEGLVGDSRLMGDPPHRQSRSLDVCVEPGSKVVAHGILRSRSPGGHPYRRAAGVHEKVGESKWDVNGTPSSLKVPKTGLEPVRAC
jgi:hypothetical protein